jgi:hypothetical protein
MLAVLNFMGTGGYTLSNRKRNEELTTELQISQRTEIKKKILKIR